MDDQLDPKVLALTKAIGKAETPSGDYNSMGDSGNSHGVYQMSQDFIKKWAPVAGVNYQEGKPLDMESQNRVAYNAVKTMGTSGDPSYPHLGKLSPAQIASAWNAGDPNAYQDPNYGKNNAYGSTQNYVKKVEEHFTQELGQSNQNGQSSEETASNPLIPSANASGGEIGGNAQPTGVTWLDAVLGLGAAGVGYVAKNAGRILSPTPQKLLGAATGAWAGEKAGMILPGIGNVTGPIAGGITGYLSGGGNEPPPPATPTALAPQLQGNPLQELTSLQSELPQAQKASQTLYEGFLQSLQGTQSGRNFANSQQGQGILQGAADYGLTPNIDENGAFDFTDFEKKRTGMLGNLAEAEKKMVSAEGERGAMMSVDNFGSQYLGNDKSLTPNERKEAIQKMREEIKSYAPLSGSMDLGDMVDARHQQYGATKGKYGQKTSAQIAAHKAAAFGFRQTIGTNTKNKNLYESLLKEESKLINAKQISKHLAGKKAPKNTALWQSFLRSAARYAEIYIGDRLGGPMGAILGSMVGEHINKKIDKKFGKTIFETKGMKEAFDVLKDSDPRMYKILHDRLLKEGIDIKPQGAKGKEGSIKGLLNKKPSTKGIGLVSRELHGDKVPD